MCKKYYFLLISLGFIFQAAVSQVPSKPGHFQLQSISSIGLLNGSAGTSLSLESILGVSYQRSFTGIGIGLDYYRFRSIPVFFDIRHEFGKGKRNIFIYGNAGYNFDWLTEENHRKNTPFASAHNYKGGLYYDAGIGYKIGFKNTDALLFSAGYAYKQLKNESGTGVCPIIGPCYTEIQTYRYKMPRIVLKAGWRF